MYERCSDFERIEHELGYKTFLQDEKKFIKNLDFQPIPIEENIIKIEKAALEFDNVFARYGENMPDVINGMSFKLVPGEKVGVVGPSGAGKSTLIQLIWQYLQPSQGKVLIDGQDISKFDLKGLRSQIMILSQDTDLFEGTLKENIDPLEILQNEKIIEILKELEFTKNQSYNSNGLNMVIKEEGSNLSEGEKKTIAFCRSLVSKKKLVI